MLNLINEKLGVSKFEAILVAVILLGLALMFKEQITTLLTDILFSELNSSINQLLN